MGTWSRRLRAPAVGLSIAMAVAAALPARADEPVIKDKVDVVAAKEMAQSPAPVRKKASKQESIGVVTGLAVGAAAGGPIGAIVGAAAGGWLGDHYHKQEVAKQQLAQSLDKSEAERGQLEHSVAALNDTLHDAQSERGKFEAALERGGELATAVSFRTDDATLSEESTQQLKKLAGFASGVPGIKVRVSGYADPRGSQDYNLALSKRRAEAVAAVFGDAGIPSDRLIVEARGAQDAKCAAGDMDGYALERRVSVRLEATHSGAVARAD